MGNDAVAGDRARRDRRLRPGGARLQEPGTCLLRHEREERRRQPDLRSRPVLSDGACGHDRTDGFDHRSRRRGGRVRKRDDHRERIG